MTMLDPGEVLRLEQSRRRAVRILTFVLSLTGLFCVFLMVQIISPPPKRIDLGKLEDFPIGITKTLAVPRLDVSTTLQNRPSVSEDPLYVTRRSADEWQAVLGWDSESGCIVQPNVNASTFTDPCSGRVYDANGKVTNDPRRLRLGLLTLETKNGQLILVDKFADL